MPVAQDPMPLWSSHFSGPKRFAELHAARRWGRHSHPAPEAEALADELRRLREAGFRHVARIVEASVEVAKTGRPDAHLFDLGEVLVSSRGATILALASEEVDGLLARHVAGDAGEHGKGWHELEIGPDVLAANDRHPIAIQNKATLRSGRGLIRSRYRAYRPDVDDLRHPAANQAHRHRNEGVRRRNEDETFEVVTLLGPGGPKTLVYTSLC